ncbi:MAG: LemA family protein [Sedimentibacter sp.]|uniref:LemA family protein n=1 Tax=Sedimentibacter sp. TaxID=1960295 RepID=UPI0031593DD3
MEILIAVVVILAGWIAIMYNGLVRKRNYITEAWASIDVQLKRKTNILTNLVDTIKMQTKYESETLEKIIGMRAKIMSGSKDEVMAANDSISKMIPSIMAISESYPELKSNQSFLHLMDDVKNVEDKIAYARTRYNTAVVEFNTAIQSFPASLFAGMFGFTKENTYEITEEEREYSDNIRISKL